MPETQESKKDPTESAPAPTFLFRVIDSHGGAHVDVRVWAGEKIGSRGFAGHLMFRKSEWRSFCELVEDSPNVEIDTWESQSEPQVDADQVN